MYMSVELLPSQARSLRWGLTLHIRSPRSETPPDGGRGGGGRAQSRDRPLKAGGKRLSISSHQAEQPSFLALGFPSGLRASALSFLPQPQDTCPWVGGWACRDLTPPAPALHPPRLCGFFPTPISLSELKGLSPGRPFMHFLPAPSLGPQGGGRWTGGCYSGY